MCLVVQNFVVLFFFFRCKITTIFATDNAFCRFVCVHSRIFDIGQQRTAKPEIGQFRLQNHYTILG